MKNYEEMAKLVLEARDEHVRKRKKHAAMMKVILPVSAGFCFAALIWYGFGNNGDDISHIQNIPIIIGSGTSAVSEMSAEAKTTASKAASITSANTETAGASATEAAAIVASPTTAAAVRTELTGSSAGNVTTQTVPQTVQTSAATSTKRPAVTTSVFVPPWFGGVTTVDLSPSETTDTTTTATTQTTAVMTASDVMSNDNF